MSRVLPKFRELPDECTCLGEGPMPSNRLPRVGAMPELVTYQCPACGHVVTIEQQENAISPVNAATDLIIAAHASAKCARLGHATFLRAHLLSDT